MATWRICHSTEGWGSGVCIPANRPDGAAVGPHPWRSAAPANAASPGATGLLSPSTRRMSNALLCLTWFRSLNLSSKVYWNVGEVAFAELLPDVVLSTDDIS